MTKKEKIVYSFVSNIIDDENSKDIVLLTKKDISKLLHRLEKTDIHSIFISPEFNENINDIYDLYIVLDDINLSETDIGKIKNLLSQKIVVFTDFKNEKKIDKKMLKLGFQTELRDKTNKLKCFSYNLKNYNANSKYHPSTSRCCPGCSSIHCRRLKLL